MKCRRMSAWLLECVLLLPAVWHGAAAQDFERQVLSSLTPNVWDVAVADLDNDGDLDLVATGSHSGAVWWIENTPGGMNTFPIGFLEGQGPRGVECGDFVLVKVLP